jgi:SAM-dependent MidA family methyltransferase
MERSTRARVAAMEAFLREYIRQTPTKKLPFVQVMEMALYHPSFGYYTSPIPKLGKQGDFFTNLHVSELFGYIVADYFFDYWQRMAPSTPLYLVEIGGGDGRFMQQLGERMQQRGVNAHNLCCFAIERSMYHRQLQQERLTAFPYPVIWAEQLSAVPQHEFSIVFSHELFDAFAVHRLRWVQGRWQECYIDEHLQETWGELSSDVLQHYLQQVKNDWAEGQQIEVNLQAKSLLAEIDRWLTRGLVWTLDYGGTGNELHSLRYWQGTMRYYYQHRQLEQPYTQLGAVDMTAHVNFSDLIRWGEQLGWSTIFYGVQATFLQQAGIFTYSEKKYRQAIKQFLFAMGEQFRVLCQQKTGS